MSLVSLNDYKEFARISQSDVNEDEKLQRIADETEAEVKEFLNRDLETATYTEKYDGTGEDRITLKQFPITSVTSVKVYDGLDSLNAEVWDTWVQGTDYERFVYSNEDTALYVGGTVFPEGDQNIEIVYVAGYTATTSGATELPSGYNVPLDIVRACKQLFTLNFNEQEGRRTIGLESVGVGAEKSVTLDLNAHDKILKRIEKYRALNV